MSEEVAVECWWFWLGVRSERELEGAEKRCEEGREGGESVVAETDATLTGRE